MIDSNRYFRTNNFHYIWSKINFHWLNGKCVMREAFEASIKPMRSWGLSDPHHQIETFPVLLALCAGNSPVIREFPTQSPVMWSFDVFFDLHLNKQFNKQSWVGLFEIHRAHYDITVIVSHCFGWGHETMIGTVCLLLSYWYADIYRKDPLIDVGLTSIQHICYLGA